MGTDVVIDSTMKSKIKEIDGEVAKRMGSDVVIDSTLKSKIKTIDTDVLKQFGSNLTIDDSLITKISPDAYNESTAYFDKTLKDDYKNSKGTAGLDTDNDGIVNIMDTDDDNDGISDDSDRFPLNNQLSKDSDQDTYPDYYGTEITITISTIGTNYSMTATTINGQEVTTIVGTGLNPALTLKQGHAYKFVHNGSGHPFKIFSSSNQNIATLTSGQTVNLIPEMGSTYKYICTAHASMTNSIFIETFELSNGKSIDKYPQDATRYQ